jgi:hypothetical protein
MTTGGGVKAIDQDAAFLIDRKIKRSADMMNLPGSQPCFRMQHQRSEYF